MFEAWAAHQEKRSPFTDDLLQLQICVTSLHTLLTGGKCLRIFFLFCKKEGFLVCAI